LKRGGGERKEKKGKEKKRKEKKRKEKKRKEKPTLSGVITGTCHTA